MSELGSETAEMRRERVFPGIERTAYVIFVGLACVPYWLVAYPAMLDLSQHVLQAQWLARLMLGDELPSGVRFNWVTPYWLFYLEAAPFFVVFETEAAIRFTLTTQFLLYIISFATARFLTGGDVLWDWLAVPAWFGLSHEYGFMPFMAAIPPAVLTLGCLMKWSETAMTTSRLWKLSGLLMLTLIAHGLVFLFLVFVLVLLLILSPSVRLEKKRKALPLLLPIVVFLAWLFLAFWLAPRSDESMVWNFGWHRLRELPRYLTGQLRWQFGVLYLIAISTLIMSHGLSQDVRRITPLIAVIAMTGFAPWAFSGTYHVNERFAIFLPVAAMLSCSPQHIVGTRDAVRVAPATGLARRIVFVVTSVLALSLSQTKKFIAFDTDAAAFTRATADIPSKKSLLAVAVDPGSVGYAAGFASLPGWLQVYREIWVDPNFTRFALPPFLGEPWPLDRFPKIRRDASGITIVDVSRVPVCDYDFVLVRAVKPPSIHHQRDSGCKLFFIQEVADWRTFAVKPDDP